VSKRYVYRHPEIADLLAANRLRHAARRQFVNEVKFLPSFLLCVSHVENLKVQITQHPLSQPTKRGYVVDAPVISNENTYNKQPPLVHHLKISDLRLL